MERALSIINELPSNQKEIDRFVAKIKSEILAGGDDPLRILIQLKQVEKTIEILLKDKELDNYFIGEATKYGTSFEHLDTHFDIRETGVRYDYANCRDSVWEYLNLQSEKLSGELKARELFLRNIPLEGVVNPDTGELIVKPSKTSTTKVCTKL